jgi:hypothetical protein
VGIGGAQAKTTTMQVQNNHIGVGPGGFDPLGWDITDSHILPDKAALSESGQLIGPLQPFSDSDHIRAWMQNRQHQTAQ